MAADRYLRFDALPKPFKGRPLLWPVHVWKVTYPETHSTKINLFQKAILELAQAQCKSSSEIAEFLELDHELVAFIIATQLIPNGWMTELGAVTSEGEKVLKEMQCPSEKILMGYAYQDAISGDWLPRFTTELPEIEPNRFDERGYPIFLHNRESGQEDRPFRLNHIKESTLNLDLLFDACKRYRIDHKYAQQRERNSSLPTRINIKSLNYVSDSAQPMWLWTWVFPDKAGEQPWRVADPFGLQTAVSWLRKPLQEILPKNDGAARYIASMFGKAQASDLSATEWLLSIENQTDLSLLVDYPWSCKVPTIERYLASVLRKNAVLADRDRNWQEDVISLVIETHNLIESVLQWMLTTFPGDMRRLPDKSQDKNKNWTRDIANKTLRSIPVNHLTEEVIRRLSSQNLRDIRNALTWGNSSLKALLFAALFSTFEHDDHPLRILPAEQLALARILNIADARNKKAGHATDDKISQEDAIDYAKFVIKWVQIFKDWY